MPPGSSFLFGRDRLELVQRWVDGYVGGRVPGDAYREVRLTRGDVQ